ncbi:hypothetical protein [Flavitalea sp.]|nr:hypothetical protein [Flavitalea sp.]
MATLIFVQLMRAHYKFRFEKKIRLGGTLSLIFFAFVLGLSCSNNSKEEVSLVWENKKAKGVTVSKHLLKEDELDSIRHNLVVHLKDQPTAVLGDYLLVSDHVLFTPAFPFTAGKEYEVVYKQKLLKQFSIPFPDSADAPRLLGLYPSTDTLPENILKLYLNFSAPMREGESLKHISLVNNKGDTLHDTFLDLQPELWNPERNVLTVWFDPGRIKRDLIPNLRLGNPLKSGEVYTLLVSSDWKDARGLPLKEEYRRNFIINIRDSISPDPNKWKIDLPVAGTKEPLKIEFPEPLDYFLLKEVITVTDQLGRVVPGLIRITAKEHGIDFYPQTKWTEGEYHLRVGSHLEDLAGNNINRLFEKDFIQSKLNKDERFVEITCKILPPGNP